MSLSVEQERRPVTSSAGVARAIERLPPIVRAMRPLQWTKNALVFAALVFDQKLFEAEPLLRAGLAFLCFCAVSSAIYLINDLRDVEADRHHPIKRYRPIAAGEVGPRFAFAVAVALLTVSLVGAAIDGPRFLAVIAGYASLMVAYSAGLKQLVILDVFAIAAGFVLRAAGGAVAIDVPI